MKSIIRRIKSIPFEFQQKFNSIYKQQSQFVANNTKQQQKQLQYHTNAYPELDRFFFKFANSRPIQGRVSGKSIAFVIGAENVGKTLYINKNLIELNKKAQSARSMYLSQLKNIPTQSSTTPKNKPTISQSQLSPLYSTKIQFNANKSPQYLQSQIMQSQFQSPHLLLIKKDYSLQGQGKVNFINFIEDLHEDLMRQIVRVMVCYQRDTNNTSSSNSNSGVYKGNNKKNSNNVNNNNNANIKNQQQPQQLQSNILTPTIIKDITLSVHSAEYLYIHLKDVVFAIMQQKDLMQLSKKGIQLLQQFNFKYLQAGGCQAEAFFNQYFQQLISIIHQHKVNNILISSSQLQQLTHNNISLSITALQIFYSIHQRMEYQHRPQGYQYSFYKSGIETTDFLFEVMNFLTGVGKYVEGIQKQYKSIQLEDQRQQFMKQLLLKNNFILNGGHVDSLLCLTNLQHLLCYNTRQPQFLNWVDHIILRTVQSSGIRHHFPIMMEMPNRKFLDQLLQLGKIQGSNPVIIEIPGYIQTFLKYSNLIEVFDEKRAIKLFNTFGRNPHTWKKALQNMAIGVDFDQIASGQALYQQKQKIVIQAKLNRVYTDQICMPLINQGMLDFEVMQVLRLFGKVNGMGKATMSFLGTALYKKPHFQAMLDKGIFWHGYYLPYMDYSSNLPSYLSIFQHLTKKINRNNSYLSYLYWRHFIQQYKLSVRDLRYKKIHQKIMIQRDTWGREHIDLQFQSTYYGPLKDYNVQYMVNTKPIGLMS